MATLADRQSSGSLCGALCGPPPLKKSCCVKLSPQIIHDPDPSIYTQQQIASAGSLPSYDNPDIDSVNLWPVSILDPINARVRNLSADASANQTHHSNVVTIKLHNYQIMASVTATAVIDFSKDVDLVIDGGDCHSYSKTATISGHLRVIDPYFWMWGLDLQPATHTHGAAATPSCRTYLSLADNGAAISYGRSTQAQWISVATRLRSEVMTELSSTTMEQLCTPRLKLWASPWFELRICPCEEVESPPRIADSMARKFLPSHHRLSIGVRQSQCYSPIRCIYLHSFFVKLRRRTWMNR